MIDYTEAGREMAKRLFTGQNSKNIGIERLCNELGALHVRLKVLETRLALEQLDD